MTRDEIVKELRSLDREVVEEVLNTIHDESEMRSNEDLGDVYHKMYLLLSMLIDDENFDVTQKVWDEEYENAV